MKKPLRILHFASLINFDDFIDVILKNANRAEFELMACTMTRESNIKEPNLAAYGIPHFVLGTKLTKADFFKTVYRLYRVIRREKIDIIHSHHYYESLMAVLAARLAGKRKVIVSRHYHNELYLTTKGFKLTIYLFLEKLVNRYASIIIAPSSAIVDLLVKQKVNELKVKRIPYAFDFASERYKPLLQEEREAIRDRLKIQKDQFVVGNFARHHKIKGQDLLLRTFAEFINMYEDSLLIMVGDGPIHQQLISLASQLKIESKVMFLGWQRDIRSIMAAVDVVFHSTHQEAFPQIMIESMALEKPLLITKVSGATDIVQNDVNGFLLSIGDTKEWINTLQRVRQFPQHTSMVGRNGRVSVMNTLSLKKIIPMVEDLYTSVDNE